MNSYFKNVLVVLILMVGLVWFIFCYNEKINIKNNNNNGGYIDMNENNINKIYIKINDRVLSATLEDNSSSKDLVKKLKENDIEIEMSDYGNFEKVGELGFNLPTNDEQITTSVGDIILYQGNKITIYYDTNTWNFTKLGKIDNITQEELKNILGNENITVIFSINR